MLYSVRDTDPASLQNLQFFASFGVREEDNTAYFVFLHDGSGREVRHGRGKPWGLCDAAETPGQTGRCAPCRTFRAWCRGTKT